MRTTLLRLANTEFGARRGITVLTLILIVAAFCSALSAYEEPFWYDEICTVILCRLPSASAIWKALDHAADTNPPLFYLIARVGRQLIPDDHLGYRLPSILGLLSTVLCMYAILSRRVDRLSALVGAAFVLCTPVADYAFEARPYALMVGCVAAAILAWQRIDDSGLYSFALAITLATALSLHYYAILVWPAFVLTEASVWVCSRRFRTSAWIALVLGAAPLLVFANLLLHLRQYYGRNFWAHPRLRQIFAVPSYLFNFNFGGDQENARMGVYWGWSFTVGVVAILVFWSFTKPVTSCSSGQREVRKHPLLIAEFVLTVALLLLPVIGVTAAKVSGGGMTYKYMLPTILGGALAVGYLTSKAAHALRAALLALVLMNYGLSSVPVVKKVLNGSLLENRAKAAGEAEAILAGQHRYGLPIVVSSGLQYLPMVYYMPADQNVGLYALTDAHAAVTFAGTDSVDLALLVLRQYFPLQVEDYREFGSKHREFILVSHGGRFDWWPSRLSHDGHMLSLVSADGGLRVYKVTLRPQAP